MATAIDSLRAQVDKFFGLITDGAVGEVLDSGLPIVGPIANAVAADLLGEIKQAIADALDGIEAATSDEAIAQQIAQALDGLVPGLTATATGDKVSIGIVETDTVSFDRNLPQLDIGSDGLGLELGGSVGLKLGLDLNATLSFDVSDKRLDVIDQDGIDTAAVHLEGSLKALDTKGELGFLKVQASDAFAPAEIKVDAAIDVAGGKVTQLISQPLADALDIAINGRADLKLALVAGVSNPESLLASVIPTIYTNLTTHYDIAYDPFGVDPQFGSPKIAFEDVQIDTGSLLAFLGDVFQPVFDGVFGSFPMKQLLNTVTAKLPVISDALGEIGLLEGFDYIDDGKINLLDLGGILASAAGATKESIQAFSQAISLIQGLSALSDELNDPGGRISLGTFNLLGGNGALSLGGAGDIGDTALQDLADALAGQANPSGTDGLGAPAASLADLLDGTGFKIPLLTDSSAILSILTNGFGGQPIDLIKYDVPELAFNARFEQFFNIVGPFGVGFYGDFGAKIDFAIGYDTQGLLIEKGKFANGFYFDADGTPVGTVTAEVGAKAGVNVGIAEAGVSGGLFSELNAYFDDEDGDGKLRLVDVGNCLFDPITGQFGIKVQAYFTVGFSPFDYTKRFDIVRVVLANFENGCPPPETQPDHGLSALGITAAQTLTLHAGQYADRRIINKVAGVDGEESYVISNAANGAVTVSAFGLAEINGNPKAGPKTDDKIAPKLIEAHMGKANDQVALDEDVAIQAKLWGDDGDDLLASGSRADELRGGVGADRLLGRAGNDKLYGEAGDDLLEGGAGADILVGGPGGDDDFDQVTYENSVEGVRIKALAGLGLFIGEGGDAQGDKLYSIEHLIGSHYNDVLAGTANGRNILEGLDGADILEGGNTEDLLLGGGAADTLRGNAGSDTVSYLSSAGQVAVDLSTGKGFGSDAQGDTFDSVENVQGGFADDSITGDASANRIDGWFGDDFLRGNAGKDQVSGGAGADFILGGADGDTISGGGGIGGAEKDTLSYADHFGGVTISLAATDFTKTKDLITRALPDLPALAAYSTIENLWGSGFNDTLTGDAQANTILGLNGKDAIEGGDGDDIIVGGIGADQIGGGNGRDLASYRFSVGGVKINLSDTNLESGGDAQADKLTDIEDLRGSTFADTLIGDAKVNRIDAGLSRSAGGGDVVSGGSGGGAGDLLIVDWSEGDIGKGLIGGFAANQATSGFFERQRADTTDRLDRIDFTGIERLQVIGTVQGDIISGGGRNDLISAGDGADIVYTGRGLDQVDAGAGDDAVAVGTGTDGLLSLEGGNTFGFVTGGAGIDILSLSLAAVFSDVVLSGQGGGDDFHGVNYAPGTGSAITDFEVLFAVYTGFGDDDLTQRGLWNNVFATGFGVDVIDAGQGVDIVDGGLDFRMGTEIDQTPVSEPTLIALRDDFVDVFANDGDFLDVDYSNASAGILSEVAQVDTGYRIRTADGERFVDLYTNNGFYRAGDDRVDFANIERVRVIGSDFADGINGTDLTYGINTFEGPDQEQIASDSRRGDDLLYGMAGDDFLIGGTGNDTLNGGDGDDVLLGAKFATGRTEPLYDQGEIDQLIGGVGRDTFIVGLGRVFYSDLTDQDQTTGHLRSTANRALVADFSKQQDTLLLSAYTIRGVAPAALYTAVERDGDTFIYLKDGAGLNGKPDASRNELIAELDGVTGFNLKASYVLYATLDGRYLRGDGTETGPPPALDSALSPENHAALAAAHDGAHDFGHDAAPAPLPVGADPGRPGNPAIPAAAAAAASGWVQQNADAQVLKQALFGFGNPLSAGTLTLEGNSAGFGLFKGDPFGLGSGVILSTGRVEDVDGVNLIDGGRQTGATVNLKFELAGTITADGVSSVIYRVNLAGLGFDLNSLKLDDSNSGLFGGVNTSSGFDIDALWLSHEDRTGITTAAQANGMSRLDAFSFDYARTAFGQGTLRDNAGAAEYTEGVVGGLIDFQRASLNTVDGRSNIATGSVTMGDGGMIGFDLNQPVDTNAPLWLYVAEAGTSGETLTAGLTASENRLTAPADLSSDLGRPGGEDDTVSMTYTFQTRGDQGSNTIAFDFVFFSEEFAEFANAGFNDKFKVTLNGVNLARLSDGSFASIDTLYSPAAGPDATNSIYALTERNFQTDFIYNPVGEGPAADQTRADGYSRTLHFVGNIIPGGVNELKIEVQDTGDGLLDSGILIKGGEFVLDTRGDFQIDRETRPLHEGQSASVDYGVQLPEGTRLDGPITVIFTPDKDVDLGAGAGRAVVRTLDPDNPFGDLTYTVIGDGRSGRDYFTTVGVTVRGLEGTTTVAPLVIQVDDDVVSRSYTVGDAAADRPQDWQAAWSHDGLSISHTADVRTGGYTAATLSAKNPTVLEGGDLYRGDLGVSGYPQGSRVPQEIARGEALRFDFAGKDVTAFTIDFAAFEVADRAHIQVIRADGETIFDFDDFNDGSGSFALSGLEQIASVIVFADAGTFLVDSLAVTENAVVRAPSLAAFRPADDVMVMPLFVDDRYGPQSLVHLV